MNSKKVTLFKKPKELLEALGTSIREIRKMRMITVTALAAELDLSRTTIHLIEKGSPSVSMGAYMNVMFLLGFSRKLTELINSDIQREQLYKFRREEYQQRKAE